MGADRHRRRGPTAVVAMLTSTVVAGCGLQIPTDPDRTLAQVRATGELRVGVSPHPPFTTLPSHPGGEPGGGEVVLVRRFAEEQGAEALFVVDGEEALVKLLETGELDVMVGGLSSRSPWSTKVALTRPYTRTQEEGRTVKHVMAVVRGENALLSELERFLDEESR